MSKAGRTPLEAGEKVAFTAIIHRPFYAASILTRRRYRTWRANDAFFELLRRPLH